MTDSKRFIERTLQPTDQVGKQPWNHVRFSLQGLMLLMTFLAITSAVAFALPPVVGAIVCLILQPCFVAVFVSGALASKGELRFFCFGALVPVVQKVLAFGGNVGFREILIKGRVFAGLGRNRSLPLRESLLEYWERLSLVLNELGRPIMFSLLAFCFVAACCGYCSVWARRFALRVQSKLDAVEESRVVIVAEPTAVESLGPKV